MTDQPTFEQVPAEIRELRHMIERMAARLDEVHPPQEWFTVAEAAQILGVARETVYRHAKRNEIQTKRVAGTLRVWIDPRG